MRALCTGWLLAAGVGCNDATEEDEGSATPPVAAAEAPETEDEPELVEPQIEAIPEPGVVLQTAGRGAKEVLAWQAEPGTRRRLVMGLRVNTRTGSEPAPLFETPGLAVEAVDAIAQRAGGQLNVALLDIRGQELTLHVQGSRPGHIDRWVWMRQPGMLYGSWTRVRGPEAAQPLVPTLDPEMVFFQLDEFPLDDLPGLIDTILPRAMLEEPALPQSIRIERQLLLVGGTRAGGPAVSVHWSTGRESAYVYLNMDGSVRSANVSGTLAARGLDMVRDDWHLPMAAQDFEFLRGFPEILKVDIEPRDIDITYMDPQDPGNSTGIRWTLDGLRVNAPMMRDVLARSGVLAADPRAVFNFDEIDFGVLPGLKVEALARVDEPGTRVLRMIAERQVTGTGPPELHWTLTIGDPAKQGNLFNQVEGEKWEVVATPGGEIVRVMVRRFPEDKVVTLEVPLVRLDL